ncbi:hypothetical protein RB195_026530 [Necator americanus]|uniref:Reverse transcriptase domain-containing protein n=1 Tax=Necator americanus TaxID=51031 RepID=A0ABR1EWL6_NECAM
MAVKVDTGEVELRVVSAYAPQMGCSEEEKACFWEDLERYVQSLEDEEVLLFGGDFNGHVGSRKDGFESCHGGYGYGARNDDESWNHVAAQHHLPVMDLKISRPRTRHPRTETQRMKWWNLKDRKKAAVREKKSKYKLWWRTRQPEDRSAYLAAKREAKKAVSKAKSEGYKAVYDMLDTREGERAVYRLVRARHCSTLDMEHTKIVKGADGAVLRRPGHILERWREYYNHLCNEEFCHPPIPTVPSVEGPVLPITAVEASAALAKMKSNRTIDAIHAVRILLEKDREKNRSVHLAFLDLVEAFDRVPAELLWMSMRSHRVPEEYVRWIKLLHAKPTSVVRCAAGTSRPFPIQVGAHQGSPLSPLLFILCMDTITKEIQKQHPWALLFADDVMFASESRDDLQKQVLEGSAAAIWIAPQHIKN